MYKDRKSEDYIYGKKKKYKDAWWKYGTIWEVKIRQIKIKHLYIKKYH